VFKGITDGELDVLDIFEDEEYVRETVGVSLSVSPFSSDSPKRMIASLKVPASVSSSLVARVDIEVQNSMECLLSLS
jgi:hypothetical protein